MLNKGNGKNTNAKSSAAGNPMSAMGEDDALEAEAEAEEEQINFSMSEEVMV